MIRTQGDRLEASVNGREPWDIQNARGVISADALGILPTNTPDQNSDAIEAAFDAMTGGMVGVEGWKIQFGLGTYGFARSIEVTKHVILQGVSGSGFSPSTRFQFPAGVHGVIIHSHASAGPGNRGDWSIVRDLGLVALGRSTPAHGVLVQGHCKLENLLITSFQGNGISIEASTGDVPATNANSWQVQYCRIDSCGGHGFHVNGADTNAGVAIGIDCSDNAGWGFYDSSFLGNTYVACHAAANALGSYRVDDANARCVFLGCYHEGGQPTPDFGPSNTLWLGGICESAINSGMALQDGRWNAMQVKARGLGQVGIWNYLHIGSLPHEGQQAYLRFWNESDPGQSLTMRYVGGGFYDWDYSAVQEAMMRWAIAGATLGGRAVPPASVVFPQGLWLGSNKLDCGAAVPSSATWYVGDRRLNSAASPGGHEGWVCVAAGTAGTYGEGRTATANGTATVSLSAASYVLRVGDRLTINGTTAFVLSLVDTTMVMSTGIPAGSGLVIAYAPPSFERFGEITGGIGDSTAAPGNATLHTRKGRSAIAAGASSVVITNELVATTSIVHATLQTVDATLTQLLTVVPAAAGFTIRGNAAATGATTVVWTVER